MPRPKNYNRTIWVDVPNGCPKCGLGGDWRLSRNTKTGTFAVQHRCGHILRWVVITVDYPKEGK